MFAEKTLEILRRYVAECHQGYVLRASKALGVPNDTLDRWVNGTRDPKLSKIGPLMDKILWGHSEPENVGVLEIKFPAIQGKAGCTEEECQRLREELQDAKDTIARLEKEVIAVTSARDELRQAFSSMLGRVAPTEARQEKSCA